MHVCITILEQVLSGWGEVWHQWEVIPVETIPGIRRGRMKESTGRDELKYDIFDTL
jgi:hypothetical protein